MLLTMTKSRRQKGDTLNLLDVFKHSPKMKHANARLDVLALCSKQTGSEEPNGWFYKQHFNSHISPEEALLYTRAAFLSYCLESYEFSQMLTRSFITHGSSNVTIDKDYLSQILSHVPNPRGTGILQGAQHHVFDDLVDAIERLAWLI